MSGEYETYLEEIIENQEQIIEQNTQISISSSLFCFVLITILIYNFIKDLMQ